MTLTAITVVVASVLSMSVMTIATEYHVKKYMGDKY